MPADDQRDVIDLLSTPEAYGLTAVPVERIDTHISIVWLVADRAFKLKRAVRFDYVDFSTIESRRLACEAEVRLNRRTAPALYRGVRAITRERDGSLTLGGSGEPVDWLVEMTRFDQDTLLDRLAERGRLDIALMDPLAAAIVQLHHAAVPRADHGGRGGMAWVVDGNARGFAEQGAALFDAQACARLTEDARAEIARHALLLEARRRGGLVRQCHGDLHLRNICLFNGVPTIFDGVEFNDEIACVDVLYDLAFLLMDLWRRGLDHHASEVFNAYMTAVPDAGALRLLPLFLSCRAAVRAKTNAASAAVQPDAPKRQALEQAARGYLDLAQTLLHPPPARLLAIGGPSGSGKSTLARGLAPTLGAVPGALVLRSDLLRKSLMGVAPTTRLDPEGYSEVMTRRVYRAIGERALAALRAGHAVIADAAFLQSGERVAIEAVARDAGVPFSGLWLEAPPDVLASRIEHRRGDASDATIEVLSRQLESDTGPMDWRRLDGTADAATLLARALAVQS